MPPNAPTVSIVLPVRDERENLGPLLEELARALRGTAHEIIAVDDGSTDGSLQLLRRLAEQWPTLSVLALGGQVGQSAATLAGCDAARAGIVVTLDADGQNDPADIPRLLEQFHRAPGCGAVVGYRARRHDSPWKVVQSRIANTLRNWITGDRVRDTGCALKVMRRDVLRQISRFEGMHRFIPTLIRLQGWPVIEAPVSHRPRRFGRSKYRMRNRALPALRDAIGVRGLRRRASAPPTPPAPSGPGGY